MLATTRICMRRADVKVGNIIISGTNNFLTIFGSGDFVAPLPFSTARVCTPKSKGSARSKYVSRNNEMPVQSLVACCKQECVGVR